MQFYTKYKGGAAMLITITNVRIQQKNLRANISEVRSSSHKWIAKKSYSKRFYTLYKLLAA